ILHELEIVSKSNNYLITFDLLLNVIERSLSTTKYSLPPITISDSSLSTSPIVIPKAARLPPPVSFSLIVQQVYYNGIETNHYHSHDNTLNSIRHRKKNYYTKTIRAMKRFEIERNLSIQTCDTIDRVKAYLGDCLVEMKNKQCSYCLH
ncbi:unnamed protein product, partial [Rotaria sordida]